MDLHRLLTSRNTSGSASNSSEVQHFALTLNWLPKNQSIQQVVAQVVTSWAASNSFWAPRVLPYLLGMQLISLFFFAFKVQLPRTKSAANVATRPGFPSKGAQEISSI